MLEAADVHKVYHTGRVELPVLRGVSLQVEPGAFLAVTGPSGAGKSTLLHLMAGLDTPTRGQVRWQGKALAGMSDRERAGFRNGAIGIVFQFYHLLPELTALENVMLPALVGGGGRTAALRKRAQERLERVGLKARLSHRPGELSGGELQRAAIARALINEPKVLLCDEPTGNLDSATGDAVADLLIGLRKREGMGLLLVTHEAELAQRADRTIHLRDGRVADAALAR